MKKIYIKESDKKVFNEMADMVIASSTAIEMIDNTPNVHDYDFTMTAVRELLDAINASSFQLMMMSSKKSTNPVSFKPFSQL